MSFNSFGFIFVFLPITLIAYWMLRKKGYYGLSVWFLVLASCFFYAVNFPEGILTFALSLGINYFLCRSILKTGQKTFLTAGVVFDVAVLAICKYAPYLIANDDATLPAPGISFYTFCEIALLAECYAGNVRRLSVREYTLLMTFFPKITQGPITMPEDILDQKDGAYDISIEQIYRGILLFVMGCFKKVIIADTLGKAVDYGFADLHSMHTGEAIVILISYTLQLYFDFSGYCDMAMAVASFFGFKLPLNFDSPYKARNISDFWKRWHITLTRFLTKYVYIPLGGNRKGAKRTYINILLVFLISGLWHGAGLTFVIWGAMHGIMSVIYRAWSVWRKKRALQAEKPQKLHKESPLTNAICTLLSFIYVGVAWMFFRAPDIKAASSYFESLGELWFPRFNYGLAKCFNIEELWYVVKLLHLDGYRNSIYILMFVILAVLLATVFFAPKAVDVAKRCRINIITSVFIVVIGVWCMLSFEGVATYLYVNF